MKRKKKRIGKTPKPRLYLNMPFEEALKRLLNMAPEDAKIVLSSGRNVPRIKQKKTKWGYAPKDLGAPV